MKKKKKAIGNSKIFLLFLAPSLLGLFIFYIAPFLMSLYYALIDNNISKKFVGLYNFIDVIRNEVFKKASVNTLRFILITVPLSVIISLSLALMLHNMIRGKSFTAIIYMLTLVIPSGSIVYFWINVFSLNGIINKTLFQLGFSSVNFSQGLNAVFVSIIMYLWKSLGYNIVLFWSGLNLIPKEYYEFAYLEGANSFKKFIYITNPYLLPTTFMVFLLSIINSFLVYKEIYLMYGNYPSDKIYILQHYMNNQFNSLNMQKLSSAAYILVLTIGILVGAFFIFQRKLTEKYT